MKSPLERHIRCNNTIKSCLELCCL